MKQPAIGETFTSGIDEITDSGEGVIHVQRGEINVGPVTKDALGVKATAKIVDRHRAELLTEEIQPPVNQLGDTTDSFTADIRPRNGKAFSATIDDISSSGNGLIYTRYGFINLGPVTDDAVGEYVHALKLPGAAARLSSDKVKPPNYIEQLEELFDYNFSLEYGEASAELHKRPHTHNSQYVIGSYASPAEVRDLPEDELHWESLEPGEPFSAEISRVSSSGNGLVETISREINIGPVKREAAGETVKVRLIKGTTAECLTDTVKADHYQEWLSDVYIRIDESPSSEMNVRTDADSSADDSGKTTGEPSEAETNAEPGSQGKMTDTDTSQTELMSTSDGTSSDFEELRTKAQEDAVEEVPDSAVTTETTKQEYTRSSAVREYVLARADGICEGCGEPAPFMSKTGDPYLHAHHIHELSDAGSDTVDTVVALCPNCHYRVHHGEDGTQFNEKLLETVQDIEST